jgi:ribosome-binding ATPase YchF (GTP1/OBG family)
MLSIGLVGLPNVGKSTFFSLITGISAAIGNYPFTTISGSIGKIVVPDKRVDVLAKLVSSKKKEYGKLQLFDIAGLIKGCSRGEGLGNQFLEQIRRVDLICHIVRDFTDESVTDVMDGSTIAEKIDLIETELKLADLDSLERRKEKNRQENDQIDILINQLINGDTMQLASSDNTFLKELNLLSCKPKLYLINSNLGEEYYQDKNVPAKTLVFNLKGLYDVDTQDDTRKLLVERFASECVNLLGLSSFFTAGKTETRLWHFKNGSTVYDNSVQIHTDIQRGFIRAEVVSFENFIKAGSYIEAKKQGKIKTEKKTYHLKDGDIIHILFSDSKRK